MANLCNSCELQESCLVARLSGIPMAKCKDYVQTSRETVRAKQTNADRIRSMTDEELAEFIVSQDKFAFETCGFDYDEELMQKNKATMLKWLRMEAKDGSVIQCQ